MATDTIVPSAPAAAAPSAPVSAPASSPAPSAPVPSTPASTAPTSAPDKYAGLRGDDLFKAALTDKFKEIEQASATPDAPAEVAVPDPAAEAVPVAEPAEVPAPDAATEQPVAEVKTEEDFQLEPEAIVTPEVLSQMVKDNAEFGKLLEADPALKGQLYKTAREAAELKPYREIFPDIDSAKAAQTATATWNDVQSTFMGSTTKEGTIATLGKIAELSYERDANGEVVMQNGEPVIGDDFYGFVDHVVGIDMENRAAEVEARLTANRYQSQDARDRDERTKAAIDILREETTGDVPEALPENLQRQKDALDAREKALNEKQTGEKIGERKAFEDGLQQEANKRITDGIAKILDNVEKQGAVVSPYLKNILPKAIASKLVRKIQANPTLQSQMQELQRLPLGDASRTRRLAAIDRAVQQYLPDVAREELREAGVQTANSAATKRAKVDGQIAATKQTEPKGSTGPATQGGGPVTAASAWAAAEGEWKQQNPARAIDKVVKEQIVGRVLQLMAAR